MGQSSEFAMLHDRLGDPVDLGISADRLVERINEDHLEVLVGGILTNPVGAQHPETLKPASDTFLQKSTKNQYCLQTLILFNYDVNIQTSKEGYAVMYAIHW